jgi:integrase
MGNIQKRPNGQWRARYRDATGREHARHFEKRSDARRWLDEVTSSIVTGRYIDSRSAQIIFQEYAEYWRAVQVHRPSSAAHVETMLRRHTYPAFGARQLGSILPSEIQAWVRSLTVTAGLAPSTVGVIHGIVSGVFRSAIRDRKIEANPCEGTRLPAVDQRLVQPLTTAQVAVLRDEIHPDLKTLITFAAGTGMRQGEVFGVSRDRLRLDGPDPVVFVDRQLRTLPGPRTEFGPLKTKASRRTIPLPDVVVSALTAHLATKDVNQDGLVFTLDGEPITRSAFGHLWRPTARVAGLNTATGTGMHALRHYYASLLIRYGESVKTVQHRLGHASAAETLDTYTHLWPDSGDRTRQAIDAELLA